MNDVSRRGRVALALAFGTAALTGCSAAQPSRPAASSVPEVTLRAGAHSVQVAAQVYCGPGQTLTAKDCGGTGNAPAQLAVPPTEAVTIEVPAPVAHDGWDIYVNGALKTQVMHTGRASYPAVGLGAQPVQLVIQSQGEGQRARGIWVVDVTAAR